MARPSATLCARLPSRASSPRRSSPRTPVRPASLPNLRVQVGSINLHMTQDSLEIAPKSKPKMVHAAVQVGEPCLPRANDGSWRAKMQRVHRIVGPFAHVAARVLLFVLDKIGFGLSLNAFVGYCYAWLLLAST